MVQYLTILVSAHVAVEKKGAKQIAAAVESISMTSITHNDNFISFQLQSPGAYPP